MEADDIIAGLVNVYDDDTTNIIVSSDKDFMQLIRDNVILFDPVSKKTRNLSEYNNDPDYFLFHKCISRYIEYYSLSSHPHDFAVLMYGTSS